MKKDKGRMAKEKYEKAVEELKEERDMNPLIALQKWQRKEEKLREAMGKWLP